MSLEINATAWLLGNIFSIIVLAFFSMMEMACVSFNRVRLQYYVSKGNQRAIWLNKLLLQPASLFGTTLIMVNIALMAGSQMARDHYAALGLNPDLAPITQVILVIVFGELAPMFAARRHAEYVAFLGIPILYAFAWVLSPVLWFIKKISWLCNRLLGGKEEESTLFLSAEELQKILQKVVEEQDDDLPLGVDNDELSAVAANIFQLREKTALQVLIPLPKNPILSLSASIEDMRRLLKNSQKGFCLVYQRNMQNIVGIVNCRDVLQKKESLPLKEVASPPWFVTEKTTLMQILKEFRINGEKIAVIINGKGQATGIITITEVIYELFGKMSVETKEKKRTKIIIDRTFAAETTVSEVNTRLGIELDGRENFTLIDLMRETLGHMPELGDSATIGPFELTVKEVSLLEVKSIGIITHH